VQLDVVVGKNDVSVPDVTLRRGESIDPAPLVSAQPLGSTKVLVQFDEGIDSPGQILDLSTGKTRKVAAGSVKVLASNEKSATVRIGRLYRLDLETAAMDPVDPPEGDLTHGFAAGGYYVYTGLDGKLNALATGEQTAVIFDASSCATFSFATGSARDDTPGWLTVPGTQNCNSPVTLQTLMNPSLHVLSGAFSALFVKSRFAFLLEPAPPPGSLRISTLRRLDLVTGDELTIREGVSSAALTPDGNSLFLTRTSTIAGRSSYAFVDLGTGNPTDVALDASLVQSFQSGPSTSAGLLVLPATGSTVSVDFPFQTVLTDLLSGTSTKVTFVNSSQLGQSSDYVVLGSSDGERGALFRYANDTGALTEMLDDVSTTVPGTVQDRFVFQHPDAVSGDLVRLAPDRKSLVPLQARAHLQTQFVEAGKRVAFMGGDATAEPQLVVANLDGSGARTAGPAADRIVFSPDGAHLIFEAQGLLWGENPLGAPVPFDELGRTGKVVVSGSGQYLVYSVLTGERRGTYRIDLGPSCTASASGCTGPAAVF
jgi:hypothetical protein